MIYFLKNVLLLKKLLIILVMILNPSISFGEQLNIKKIIINGEQRLSETYILNFLPDLPNTELNNEILNKFTKDLYNTGLFSKIILNVNETILQINVEEYPIINEIFFSGNDLIDNEALNEIILIKTRDVFNENELNDSIENIKTEYQKIGRYLAEVTVKKIEIDEGRVNLNFEINEGAILVVKNINFKGNKSFSASELKSNISTKEDAWYKILVQTNLFLNV